MKMTVIFNEKRGVINLTSHNMIVEDFKEHICKRLKINPLDYKLKIDFLNNSIEPLLISAKSEKMNMEKQNIKISENQDSHMKYDLEKSHLKYSDLKGLKSVELGYGNKDYYTLHYNGLQLLKQQMLNKGGLDCIIYYNDVLTALCEQSER